VKYFRFQSNDVIRTSENSRNFRVSGKRHLKTASFAENTNVQNSQKLRPWAGLKSVIDHADVGDVTRRCRVDDLFRIDAEPGDVRYPCNRRRGKVAGMSD
jgi:hypothetical protein